MEAVPDNINCIKANVTTIWSWRQIVNKKSISLT